MGFTGGWVYDTTELLTGFGADPGISYKEWFDANEQREAFRRSWGAFFLEFDILIIPSFTMVAFPKDEDRPFAERRYASRCELTARSLAG